MWLQRAVIEERIMPDKCKRSWVSSLLRRSLFRVTMTYLSHSYLADTERSDLPGKRRKANILRWSVTFGSFDDSQNVQRVLITDATSSVYIQSFISTLCDLRLAPVCSAPFLQSHVQSYNQIHTLPDISGNRRKQC